MTDLSRWRMASTDRLTKLRETAGILRLILSTRRDETTAIYDLLAAHNNLGEQTLYLNMGYWKNAKSYDQACEALALLLGESAGLTAGQQVVDAGYGFGDQDILWAKRFGVKITGFNITAKQVQVARERVQQAGVADRVDLRLGSALETGLPDASADRVLALESAFHFPSRDAFFKEAHRVLRPGGRIALADIAWIPKKSRRLLDRVKEHVARASWQIPDANAYDADTYAARLTAAGFVDVQVRHISEDVFVPFMAYARVRQGDPDVVARANPLMRAVWRSPSTDRVFDYLVITARRPERAA